MCEIKIVNTMDSGCVHSFRGVQLGSVLAVMIDSLRPPRAGLRLQRTLELTDLQEETPN